MSTITSRAAVCSLIAAVGALVTGSAVAPGGAAVEDAARSQALLAFQGRADGDYEIYVARPDGAGLRRLTRNSVGDRLPEWSPDGRRILFVRGNNEGVGSYHVMRADGSGSWRLGKAVSPHQWSPDGRKIAFTERGISGLGIVNADGSGRRWLYRDEPRGFEWSPNGTKIAFGCGPDVCVVAADGTSPKKLLGSATAPHWSPDGRRIAFLRPLRRTDTRYGVYLARADGSGVKRLPVRGGGAPPTHVLALIEWSPDGRRLAIHDGGRLGVADADGRRLRWIYRGELGDVLSLFWSPDGLSIAFDCGGDSDDVCVASAATGAFRNVTLTEDRFEFPGPWSPGGDSLLFQGQGIFVLNASSGTPVRISELYGHDPSWSPDGRWISFWANTARPDLYVASPDGRKLTRIARLALRETWQPRPRR